MMSGWNTSFDDLAKAIADFETALPGFWWIVGQGSVGAHASCGVDSNGVQSRLLDGIEHAHPLYYGIHCDTDKGSPSEALRNVMAQALADIEMMASTRPKTGGSE